MSPTSKAPASGLLLTLLVGLVTALILSPVYAYILRYMPFIYVNFLFTLGFGYVLGGMVSKSSMWGKIRSTAPLYIIAFITALVAEYAQWVVTIYIYTDQWVVLPTEVLDTVIRLGKIGLWSLESHTVKGSTLYGIWGLEALVIFGLTFYAVMDGTSRRIFCETCSKWVTDASSIKALQISTDMMALVEQIKAGSFEKLKTLETMEVNPSPDEKTMALPEPRLLLELFECASCTGLYRLSLSQMSYSYDKEGDMESKRKVLIDRMEIDAETFKSLSQIA